MPISVRLHQLADLSHKESPDEIFLETTINTQLYIQVDGSETIIDLPRGNKFDIINGKIIIHQAKQ